jgi:hypothetical protein
MQHLLNHLIQHHVIPLLLIPVAISGVSCFAVYELLRELHDAPAADLILLAIFSIVGIIGTICTWFFLRSVRSQPVTWKTFELGRTTWSILIIFAWFAGAACGVLMIFDTSR